jgi:hypothetical protein
MSRVVSAGQTLFAQDSVPQQATLFLVPTGSETTPKPESSHVQKQAPKLEYPGKKPTPPKWTPNFDDRIAWCCWLLKYNPHVYFAFRKIADGQRATNPSRRISSENIVNLLRYHSSIRTEGDYFGVNSNAKSLFAWLYMSERQGAVMGGRTPWLDLLTPKEQEPILDALKAANDANS